MISDRVRVLAIVGVAAVCFTAMATPARAQAASFALPVAVQVVNACRFATIVPVDFGDIAAVPLTANDDAEGQIEVRCRASTQVTLTLSPGQNHNGATRRMARTVGATTYFLEYELYDNPGRTRVFISDTRNVPRVPGRTWRVLGRIPAGAGTQAGAGLHTDTVVATITF